MSPCEPGDFRIWRLDQVPVIVCPPEIDIASTDAFAAALAAAEQAAATVVVDLTATTFCDCSGLRVLGPAQERIAARGGRLRLVTTSAVIQLLLAMTGLEAGIPQHSMVADAVLAARAGQESSEPPVPH
jgi:anti-sigma B factor antagonist